MNYIFLNLGKKKRLPVKKLGCVHFTVGLSLTSNYGDRLYGTASGFLIANVLKYLTQVNLFFCLSKRRLYPSVPHYFIVYQIGSLKNSL